jgi:hypothetical protein
LSWAESFGLINNREMATDTIIQTARIGLLLSDVPPLIQFRTYCQFQ